MIPKINEIIAKTVLIKSGLPGSDYVINPYNGCLFGCMYCYAAQIARWKHPNEEWGTYLDVKTNAPLLLKEELGKFHQKLGKKNFGSIFFSSVTDPYVSLEAKYKLTRKCLEVLADFDYQGSISIQTKSPLVTKDIAILKRLKNISVGLWKFMHRPFPKELRLSKFFILKGFLLMHLLGQFFRILPTIKKK